MLEQPARWPFSVGVLGDVGEKTVVGSDGVSSLLRSANVHPVGPNLLIGPPGFRKCVSFPPSLPSRNMKIPRSSCAGIHIREGMGVRVRFILIGEGGKGTRCDVTVTVTRYVTRYALRRGLISSDTLLTATISGLTLRSCRTSSGRGKCFGHLKDVLRTKALGYQQTERLNVHLRRQSARWWRGQAAYQHSPCQVRTGMCSARHHARCGHRDPSSGS